MANRIIEISVNDEYVVGSGVVIGAAGADNSVILRAKFNDTWVGLNIYATFRDAKGENPTVELLLPTMLQDGKVMTYDIEVPKSATAIDGKMCVVFSGFAVTDNYVFNAETKEYDQLVYRDAVINTTNAYFRVLTSDFSALDVEDPAEVTVLEQVLSEINVFRGELDEHEGAVAAAISEHEGAVAGRLDAQDVTIGERLDAQDDAMDQHRNDVESALSDQNKKMGKFIDDCNNGKYTVGIAAIEKKTPAQYTDPSAANYCVDTYLIRLTDGKEHFFTVKNGRPFTVARIYSSFAEMEDGCASDGVPLGGFVVIDTGNVEDEENARLYVKGSAGYAYITDLSGAMGIQGPPGDSYELTKGDRDEIAQTVMNEKFGDLDEALDRIIAIQNELLGIITFTIAGTEYNAKKGMTWKEWVESEYNTIGAWIGGVDFGAVCVATEVYIRGKWGITVSSDAVIEAGVAYVVG